MTALPIEIDPDFGFGDYNPMAEVFDLAEKRAAKKAAGKSGSNALWTPGSDRDGEDDLAWEAFLPVFTSNIGRKVSQSKAKANITKVFREAWMLAPKAMGGAKTLGLVGFQEIDEADLAREHDILEGFRKGPVTPHAEHETLLKANRRFAGFAQATPIAIPAPWQIEDVIVTLTCQGRSKVTPHRVCVQAVCSHPGLPGYRVAFLDGHYPLARLGAEDLWDQCHQKWQDIVRGYVTRGVPVVTTRDTNHHGRMPKLVGSEQQMLPSGIDRVSVCLPENSEVQIKKVGSPKTINLNIDGHDAKGVGLKFWVPQAA